MLWLNLDYNCLAGLHVSRLFVNRSTEPRSKQNLFLPIGRLLHNSLSYFIMFVWCRARVKAHLQQRFAYGTGTPPALCCLHMRDLIRLCWCCSCNIMSNVAPGPSFQIIKECKRAPAEWTERRMVTLGFIFHLLTNRPQKEIIYHLSTSKLYFSTELQ